MQNIGELQLNKGEVRKGVTLFAWDGVQDCNPERCPVLNKCTYQKEGKCQVQTQYLDNLYQAITTTYKYLDQVMLFKIGTQIIPLYAHLMKLKIVELSLTSPMTVTSKGGLVIHPVYKEIREVLKTIAVMWKDLDLTFETSLNPDPTGSATPAQGKRDFEKGDPTYVKRMSERQISRKGVIR